MCDFYLPERGIETHAVREVNRLIINKNGKNPANTFIIFLCTDLKMQLHACTNSVKLELLVGIIVLFLFYAIKMNDLVRKTGNETSYTCPCSINMSTILTTQVITYL